MAGIEHGTSQILDGVLLTYNTFMLLRTESMPTLALLPAFSNPLPYLVTTVQINPYYVIWQTAHHNFNLPVGHNCFCLTTSKPQLHSFCWRQLFPSNSNHATTSLIMQATTISSSSKHTTTSLF
jgi:hypothetical protein